MPVRKFHFKLISNLCSGSANASRGEFQYAMSFPEHTRQAKRAHRFPYADYAVVPVYEDYVDGECHPHCMNCLRRYNEQAASGGKRLFPE
jgi:hypothetical protein